MPLSFLVHTPRLTVASVIRPCARSNSNGHACSHGFGMKSGGSRNINTAGSRTLSSTSLNTNTSSNTVSNTNTRSNTRGSNTNTRGSNTSGSRTPNTNSRGSNTNSRGSNTNTNANARGSTHRSTILGSKAHLTLGSKAHLKPRSLLAHTSEDMKMLARFFSSRGVVGVVAMGAMGGVLGRGCGIGNGNGITNKGNVNTNKGMHTYANTTNGIHQTNTTKNTNTTHITPSHTRSHSNCPSHSPFAPEIEALFHGNEEYVHSMNKMNPGLLSDLANNGQQPPFMMVDCSDSRVSEQDIFSAKPGTMFTAGNIANRFDEQDPNSNAILSFAVETLKVKHVIVMGHYGCGGVAASMVPYDSSGVGGGLHEGVGGVLHDSSGGVLHEPRSADIAVQGWIMPIRELYMRSERPEIVAHREKHKFNPLVDLPGLHDPAFRALVEENVKVNVLKIANSRVISDHYTDVAKSNGVQSSSSTSTSTTPTSTTSTSTTSTNNPTTSSTSSANNDSNNQEKPITEIYIHGWVYDVENGKVADLGVSVGPPGKKVPASPFPGVGK